MIPPVLPHVVLSTPGSLSLMQRHATARYCITSPAPAPLQPSSWLLLAQWHRLRATAQVQAAAATAGCRNRLHRMHLLSAEPYRLALPPERSPPCETPSAA
mmetsp:Transcript_23854/g.60785  ORF Transcript_23854/g.60785 Transcript_23854/m.60785 type:complete len:101 (-) Transcript_23854:369-671(-)